MCPLKDLYMKRCMRRQQSLAHPKPKGGTLMQTRLYKLRTALHLTREEFSTGAGINPKTYTNYECGRTRLSDAVIHSICSKYSVSREWLCTGCGEMFPHRLDEEKVTEWTKALFTDEKASFQQRFALMITDLSPEEWTTLAAMLEKLTG